MPERRTIQIRRLVKIDNPDAEFPEIKLFEEDGTATKGTIKIPRDDRAVITFERATVEPNFESFETLVIHPLGEKLEPADLQWKVGPRQIKLQDNNRDERTYSYTLSVQLENGWKVYLDPQLVNRGR